MKRTRHISGTYSILSSMVLLACARLVNGCVAQQTLESPLDEILKGSGVEQPIQDDEPIAEFLAPTLVRLTTDESEVYEVAGTIKIQDGWYCHNQKRVLVDGLEFFPQAFRIELVSRDLDIVKAFEIGNLDDCRVTIASSLSSHPLQVISGEVHWHGQVRLREPPPAEDLVVIVKIAFAAMSQSNSSQSRMVIRKIAAIRPD